MGDVADVAKSRKSVTRRDLLVAGAVLAGATRLARAEETKRTALLDELERRACLYFYEQGHPGTGLVLDRVRVDGVDERRVASIAATGFGLSALCIAHQRGFLTREVAEQRVERTLGFLARSVFHQNGFYFHFLDCVTGQRAFKCELSSIDTAWLLCGVIHAREHFDKSRIHRLANEIVRRVNWRWMLADGETLSHGWTPEGGFLPYRWEKYAELLAMYLLAMGSSTFPVPPSAWDAWVRPRHVLEEGMYIQSAAPLFVHQFSHAWFDFRRKDDGWTNYFENSRQATILHRSFCLSLRDRFPWIGENMWGITASDSRYGYLDWGGPDTAANSRIDGTLVPCASGGSIVFLPDECGLVLQTMVDRYGSKVWTRYGFVDAFQPEAGWYDPDVIGIDLGIMLLMAENLRTGSVWSCMMRTPEVRDGFRAAAFRDTAAD